MLPIARLGRLLSLSLALAAALCFAAPARAQGTSGQVPDPMSSVELAKLLRQYVHPTNEQVVSIEALHDGYRDRFRALRENEIERFLVKMKAMQGGVLPKKEQVEEFTKSYDRVNRQIAEIDDAFFEGVATLMGEERRIAVQRARDARGRTRAAAGIMTGLQGANASVDLSAIMLDLNLPPQEAETIDPLLIAYEQKLTAAVKELGAASMRMIRDMFDELEKAGLGNLSQEEMMNDPEKMKAMMETMQAAMAKAGERMKAKTTDLAEFNGKSFRSLSVQLGDDSKRKFRARYLAKAYPELATDPDGAESLFRMMLRIKALDDAVREQVRGAYQQWQAADNALVDQCAKEIDEARASRAMMDFSGAGMQEQMKKIQELAVKRSEIAAKAMSSAAAVVGDERIKKLTQKMIEKRRGAGNAAPDFDDATDPEADGDGPAIAAGARPMEAEAAAMHAARMTERGPIGDAAMTAIATQLALDDSRKALLETMRGDYAKRWDEEIRAAQASVDALGNDRWAKGPESEEMKLDTAKSAAYYNARKALLVKASEADAAFLGDLASVLGEKSAPVLQLVRLERVLDRTAGTNGQMGYALALGAPETAVNIATLLRTAELSAEDRGKVNAAVAALVDPLIKVQLDSFATSIDQERAMEEMGQRNMALYRNAGEQPDMAELQKAGMEMMTLQGQQTEVQARRSEAARGAWSAALGALSEEQRSALQLSYDELAYPAIFKDARSALPYIDKARALHDLTDDQRTQLQGLHDRSRAEHLEFSRKMLPKRAVAAPPSKPDEMQRYWQEQMEIANAREKVRFERDEQSQRAVSALRRILTEAQLSQIPGLAEYESAAAKKQRGPFGQQLE